MILRRSVPGQLVIALLAALMVFACWAPAQAGKKKKPRGKSYAQKRITIETDLGFIYNDNILGYSDADLDLYNADSLQEKFAIESKGDWIITPSVRPRISSDLLWGRNSTLGLAFDYYFYVKNDVRRYSRFTIDGRHDLSDRFYLALAYNYIPDYYYRNQFYGGAPGIPAGYLKAAFAKQSLTAEIGFDIVKTLKGNVSYSYQHKAFNKEFNYRDLNVNGFQIQAIWRPLGPLKLWAIYGYENAAANGADMAPNVIDVSYQAWDVTLGTRYYSRWLGGLKPQFFGTFELRNIKYQTDRYRDLFRYGREDNNYRARVGAAWRLPHDLAGEISYSFSQKRSGIPAPNQALEERLDYKVNVYTLRISRDFQL